MQLNFSTGVSLIRFDKILDNQSTGPSEYVYFLPGFHYTNASRPGQEVVITDLEHMLEYEIGMNTSPDYDVPNADRTAWGHTGQLQISFMRITPTIDLTVKPSFSHNFSGTFRTFTKGNDNAGITFSFIYKQDITCDIIYKNYYGSSNDSSYSDRDTLGLSIKKTF